MAINKFRKRLALALATIATTTPIITSAAEYGMYSMQRNGGATSYMSPMGNYDIATVSSAAVEIDALLVTAIELRDQVLGSDEKGADINNTNFWVPMDDKEDYDDAVNEIVEMIEDAITELTDLTAKYEALKKAGINDVYQNAVDQLYEKITEAKGLLGIGEGAPVAPNISEIGGIEITTSETWVTQDAWDTFEEAIEEAQDVYDEKSKKINYGDAPVNPVSFASISTVADVPAEQFLVDAYNELSAATSHFAIEITSGQGTLVVAQDGMFNLISEVKAYLTEIPQTESTSAPAVEAPQRANGVETDPIEVNPPMVSEDGMDAWTTWVTEEQYKALESALKVAESVYSKHDTVKEAKANSVDITSGATLALETALTAFTDAIAANGTGAASDIKTAKAELETQLDDTRDIFEGVKLSANGADVSSSDKWTTKGPYEIYKGIIETAQDVYDDKEATTTQISIEIANLTALQTTLAGLSTGLKDTFGTEGDALEAAIEAAKENLTNKKILVSEYDGLDLLTDPKVDPPAEDVLKWVTEEEQEMFEEAIEVATEALKSIAIMPLEDIQAAKAEIENATTTFTTISAEPISNIKKVLHDQIVAATDSTTSVVVSVNGAELDANINWVTKFAMDSYKKAIEDAIDVRDHKASTKAIVERTTNSLTLATSAFTLGIQRTTAQGELLTSKDTLLNNINAEKDAIGRPQITSTGSYATTVSGTQLYFENEHFGFDVENSQRWAEPDDIEDYNDVIEDAIEVYTNPKANLTSIKSAISTLATKKIAFEKLVTSGQQTEFEALVSTSGSFSTLIKNIETNVTSVAANSLGGVGVAEAEYWALSSDIGKVKSAVATAKKEEATAKLYKLELDEIKDAEKELQAASKVFFGTTDGSLSTDVVILETAKVKLGLGDGTTDITATITSAQAYVTSGSSYTTVSALKGEDVETGAFWVDEDMMEELEAGIKAAQAVADLAAEGKTTKEKIDEANEELKEILRDFEAVRKAGLGTFIPAETALSEAVNTAYALINVSKTVGTGAATSPSAIISESELGTGTDVVEANLWVTPSQFSSYEKAIDTAAKAYISSSKNAASLTKATATLATATATINAAATRNGHGTKETFDQLYTDLGTLITSSKALIAPTAFRESSVNGTDVDASLQWSTSKDLDKFEDSLDVAMEVWEEEESTVADLTASKDSLTSAQALFVAACAPGLKGETVSAKVDLLAQINLVKPLLSTKTSRYGGTDISSRYKWVPYSTTDGSIAPLKALDMAYDKAYDLYKETSVTPGAIIAETSALEAAITAFNDIAQEGTKEDVDAARADLEDAIDDAGDATRGIIRSIDGANVDPRDDWAPDSAFTELSTAISNAKKVLADKNKTADELDAAVIALESAIGDFENAIQAGTKGRSAQSINAGWNMQVPAIPSISMMSEEEREREEEEEREREEEEEREREEEEEREREEEEEREREEQEREEEEREEEEEEPEVEEEEEEEPEVEEEEEEEPEVEEEEEEEPEVEEEEEEEEPEVEEEEEEEEPEVEEEEEEDDGPQFEVAGK